MNSRLQQAYKARDEQKLIDDIPRLEAEQQQRDYEAQLAANVETAASAHRQALKRYREADHSEALTLARLADIWPDVKAMIYEKRQARAALLTALTVLADHQAQQTKPVQPKVARGRYEVLRSLSDGAAHIDRRGQFKQQLLAAAGFRSESELKADSYHLPDNSVSDEIRPILDQVTGAPLATPETVEDLEAELARIRQRVRGQ